MKRLNNFIYYLAISLIVYMPFHILLSQSLSLATGGLEVWKAAKDVVLFVLFPVFVFAYFKRNLFKDRYFAKIMLLSLIYGLIHLAFIVFAKKDDTHAAIVGSVYNTRFLIFLLIGYLVGSQAGSSNKLQKLLKVSFYVSIVVAVFALLQYFVLPKDFLTNFGYSLERGVKSMFFIDDKPDLPRVMSTLRDPNSLAAYLLLPLIGSAYMIATNYKKPRLIGGIKRGRVVAITLLISMAVFLTFSRSGYIGVVAGLVTILSIVKGEWALLFIKKYKYILVVLIVLGGFAFIKAKDTYLVQNFIFHADEQTIQTDPNELRVELAQKVTDEILETPKGHGPGTAGIVSINNKVEGVLTENYYLQIFYEVGWIGGMVFISICVLLAKKLWQQRRDSLSGVLFATFIGYIPLSLLNHLWTNEAVALQFWLLSGMAIATVSAPKTIRQKT